VLPIVDAGTDWDVTLLPRGYRVMRTTDFIIGGYQLVDTITDLPIDT
jgi:hypothetical protein